MEPNLPVGAKKIRSIVRLLFFMLRKGISKKSRFIFDLNMVIKRGKIAAKALHNLMFHHHHPQPSGHLSFDAPPGEYEFSCSNSPAYPISLFPFHLNKNRKHNGGVSSSHFFSCTHAPATYDEDVGAVNAVVKALEMLHSENASPALPGFGRSPMVRQLRITDSPFPLRDVDVEDSHVDEDAEDFIMMFYKELKKQNIAALS